MIDIGKKLLFTFSKMFESFFIKNDPNGYKKNAEFYADFLSPIGRVVGSLRYRGWFHFLPGGQWTVNAGATD
jgi:hypothetical protein